MNLYGTPSWFAWDRLEDSPDSRVVRDFFRLLPNATRGSTSWRRIGTAWKPSLQGRQRWRVGFHPDPIGTRWRASLQRLEAVLSSLPRTRARTCPSFHVGIGSAIALRKRNAEHPGVCAGGDRLPRTMAWAESLSRRALPCLWLRRPSRSRLCSAISSFGGIGCGEAFESAKHTAYNPAWTSLANAAGFRSARFLVLWANARFRRLRNL